MCSRGGGSTGIRAGEGNGLCAKAICFCACVIRMEKIGEKL
jgi:hypothetical protein